MNIFYFIYAYQEYLFNIIYYHIKHIKLLKISVLSALIKFLCINIGNYFLFNYLYYCIGQKDTEQMPREAARAAALRRASEWYNY